MAEAQAKLRHKMKKAVAFRLGEARSASFMVGGQTTAATTASHPILVSSAHLASFMPPPSPTSSSSTSSGSMTLDEALEALARCLISGITKNLQQLSAATLTSSSSSSSSGTTTTTASSTGTSSAGATDLSIELDEFDDVSAACLALQALARIFGPAGSDGGGDGGGTSGFTTLRALEGLAYESVFNAKENDGENVDRDARGGNRKKTAKTNDERTITLGAHKAEEQRYILKRIRVTNEFPLNSQTGGNLALLISMLPELETLDITAEDGTRARVIYPLLLQSMRTCGSALTSLALDGFHMSDAELHLTMIKLPPIARRLQVIIFSNNEFGPVSIKSAPGWRGEGIEQLASVVANQSQLANLSILHLQRNRLTDEALVLLSKALAQPGCALTDLDISHNNFGREGARALGRALSTNQALTSLSLSNVNGETQTWHQGIDDLIAALSTNENMKRLDLSNNKLPPDVATALASALENNSQLTTFNLSNNALGAEGIEKLAQVLHLNRTLTSLDLRSNNSMGQEARFLVEMLRENVTLLHLHYGDDMNGSIAARISARRAEEVNLLMNDMIRYYIDDNHRRRAKKQKYTEYNRDNIEDDDDTDEILGLEAMLLDRGDEDSGRYQTIDLSGYSLTSNSLGHIIAQELSSGSGRIKLGGSSSTPASTAVSLTSTASSRSSSIHSPPAQISPPQRSIPASVSSSSSSSSSTPLSPTSPTAPSWVWRATPSTASDSRLRSKHTDQSLLIEKVLLFGNRLTFVPFSDSELTSGRWENVTSLDLSHNQLSTFSPTLAQLANLRLLNLRFNQLQSLPSEIKNLKELRILHLNKNYLMDLPLEIFQLHLKTLSLFGNPMHRIKMHVYEQCQGWRDTIDLSYQRIGSDESSHLPTELFPGLTQLRRLVLNHNDISLLPSGIAQLESLEVLELENNRLNVLPWQIGFMTNLRVLKLDGNPLSKVPQDMIRAKGNLAAWQRYLSGLKARMDESYRMKVILVGDSMQEKSSIMQSMIDHLRPSSDNQAEVLNSRRSLRYNLASDEVQSVDLVIKSNSRTVNTAVNADVTLSALNISGLTAEDPTYHFFLVNKCLYILVVDLTTFTNESIEKWMNLLKSRAAKSVVLLVGTHPHQGCSPEQKEKITSVFQQGNSFIKKHPLIRNVLTVCTKTKKEVENLIRTVHQLVVSQPYMPAFISRGAVLFEERLASERLKRMPPIMDWDEYIWIAHDCGIAQDQVITVTKHFHRIGLISAHLKAVSRSLLNRMVLLDPLWLVQMFRAVLSGPRAISNFGVIREKDLWEIWQGQGHPSELQELLLLLLEQFGLALRLVRSNQLSNEEKVVIESKASESEREKRRRYMNKTDRTKRIESMVDSSWQNMLELKAAEEEQESKMRGEKIVLPSLLPDVHLPLNKFGWRPERYLVKLEIKERERGKSLTSSNAPAIRYVTPSLQWKRYLPLFPNTPYTSADSSLNPQSTNLTSSALHASQPRPIHYAYLYGPAYQPEQNRFGLGASIDANQMTQALATLESSRTDSKSNGMHNLEKCTALTSPLDNSHGTTSTSPTATGTGLSSSPLSTSPRSRTGATLPGSPPSRSLSSSPPSPMPSLLAPALTIPRRGVVHELRRNYRFDYLPAGFFSRLMVHLLQVVDSPIHWKHGIVLLQTSKNGKSTARREALRASESNGSVTRSRAAPTFSFKSPAALSSSLQRQDLRRSGIHFEVLNSPGPSVRRTKKATDTSIRQRDKGKEKEADIRSTGSSNDTESGYEEQRALLEELPEKHSIRVHVYGTNPGKLLRLIEANIDDLAINWFRVKTQVYVPCCHCIALQKQQLAKTTIYDSLTQKQKELNKAANLSLKSLKLDISDDQLASEMHELVGLPNREPYLFSIEECLRAITKRRQVLYCQAGQGALASADGPRTRLRRKSTSKIYLEGEDMPAVRLDNLVPDLSLADLQGFEIDFSEIKILNQIAQGPFAVVHSAIYQGECVAVKEFRILPSSASDEVLDLSEEQILSVFNEFRSEAWLMTLLDHKNLVKLEGICREPFSIVMEFLSQGNLFDYINSRGKLHWEEVLSLAQDIADGMNHLHSHSPPIIHRDLKSTNVMLSNGMAKVSDFGLSTAHSLIVKGRAVDNPMWLAVEVMRGEAYSLKSDVYSYGIILWELIACQPPYREHLEANMFWFELEQKIIGGLRPTIPDNCQEDYAELIRDCWHENVSVRPSFSQILKRLATIAERTRRDCDVLYETPTPENSVTARSTVPASDERGVASPVANSGWQSAKQAQTHLATSLNFSKGLLQPDVTWRFRLRPSHSGAVQCLCTVEDRIWAGCRDGTIRVWDQDGNVVWDTRAHHRQRINALTFCGGYVCSASSDRTIGLWSVHDFKRQNRLNGHWEEVSCLANVGQELWSGSLDGSIRIWSKKWACRRMLALESPVRAIRLVNTLVWVATDRGITVFDSITAVKVNELVYSQSQAGREWHGTANAMCNIAPTEEVWVGTTSGRIYAFREDDVWTSKDLTTPNPEWDYYTEVVVVNSSNESIEGKASAPQMHLNDDEDDRRITSMLAVDGRVWVGWRRGDLTAIDAMSRKQLLHLHRYHNDAISCLIAPSSHSEMAEAGESEVQHVGNQNVPNPIRSELGGSHGAIPSGVPADIWTGSWDRMLDILLVDDFIASREEKKREQVKRSMKRYGLRRQQPLMPGSLPAYS